ncbi:hypothetical protein SBA5_490058 [Candidatus Sulfotelmatomonas gaucii]|uniref:Uncharacterized protein n=1 Tax=Candidatus Sulfuritelmatomonas gaucii TaxID=2043161 RepID=A0A2N9LPV5_9BACT|nr:hypothetical protein SBA5_490058 [Candidatus Sulfotelmatomonas gaucii]
MEQEPGNPSTFASPTLGAMINKYGVGAFQKCFTRSISEVRNRSSRRVLSPKVWTSSRV